MGLAGVWQAAVSCAYQQAFGFSEVDNGAVEELCITPAILGHSCSIYAIGVGYTWSAENDMADW